MDPSETPRHAFIIRLWLERSAQEPAGRRWRGSITHVPDGERRYFVDLAAVVDFITPYLTAMARPAGPFERGKRALARWRTRLRRRD